MALLSKNRKIRLAASEPKKSDDYFWTAGADLRRAYKTPDELRAACSRYFEWVTDNPLKEAKLVAYKGRGSSHPMPKMRVMSIPGLRVFLEISSKDWEGYRKDPLTAEVVEWVEDVIYTQKFTGAAADLLNPTLIMRDLKLGDTVTASGPNGSPLININMSAKEAAEAYMRTLEEGK